MHAAEAMPIQDPCGFLIKPHKIYRGLDAVEGLMTFHVPTLATWRASTVTRASQDAGWV